MPSEADAIAASSAPATVATLVEDLTGLGIGAGDLLVVHSSLSALGWVAGGPQAVVQALLEVVGPDGTIVMPTQSGQLSDPAAWARPPVPEPWVEVLHEGLPAYDPYLTPTRGMGQIVECFRQHRSTLRSAHPTLSFAACGPRAEAIVGTHPLSPGLGETSPLGRLYDLDAQVLLLGVTHAHDTSLHLAEHRASWPGKATTVEGAPVVRDGRREWVTYEDLELDEGDFERLGDDFAATGGERTGPIGAGTGRACRVRAIVDFAVGWMGRNRPHRDG